MKSTPRQGIVARKESDLLAALQAIFELSRTDGPAGPLLIRAGTVAAVALGDDLPKAAAAYLNAHHPQWRADGEREIAQHKRYPWP